MYDHCDECGRRTRVDDLCDECFCCEDCCECSRDELFDADELGLDPEEDDMRLYGRPGFGELLYHELEELHRRLPIPGDPNA